MRLAVPTCAIVLLLHCLPADADILVIVNRHGVFRVDTETNPPTVTPIPADRLVIDSAIGIPNGDGGGGDMPPNPPADELTKKIVELSKRHLKSAQEARALIAMIDTIDDLVEKGAMSESDMGKAIAASLPVVSSRLGANGRLDKWLDAVKDENGRKIDRDLADKAITGLAVAWKISVDGLLRMLADGQAAQEDGSDATMAAEMVAGSEQEALDIATILMLIKAIIELLKTIGIIG